MLHRDRHYLKKTSSSPPTTFGSVLKFFGYGSFDDELDGNAILEPRKAGVEPNSASEKLRNLRLKQKNRKRPEVAGPGLEPGTP